MLGLPGAWVTDVEFGEQAMIVTVVLKAKKPVCSGCGARGLKVKGPSQQALAPSPSRRPALPARVPAQTAALPGLRRSARARGVGAWRRSLHARLRRPHGVARATDEPDAGHAADAD